MASTHGGVVITVATPSPGAADNNQRINTDQNSHTCAHTHTKHPSATIINVVHADKRVVCTLLDFLYLFLLSHHPVFAIFKLFREQKGGKGVQKTVTFLLICTLLLKYSTSMFMTTMNNIQIQVSYFSWTGC